MINLDIQLFNILVFLWLGVFALYAINRIIWGDRRSALYLFLVLFIFNGVPLLLDNLFGSPIIYGRSSAFNVVRADYDVQIVYNIYMILVPIIWLLFINKSNKRINNFQTNEKTWRYVSAGLHFLLVLPVIAVLFSPDPEVYLIYGWRYDPRYLRWVAPELHLYYGIVYRVSFTSILAGGVLFYQGQKRSKLHDFIIIGLMLLSVFFIGKRYPMAIIIFIVIFIVVDRNLLSGSTTIIMGVLGFLGLILFSVLFQQAFRGIGVDTSTFDEIYANFRIDYGRDDVVKFTLYSELYPNTVEIVPHRGDSILYVLGYFIPRSFWVEKPYSYSAYFSAALTGDAPPPYGRDNPFMTTSWLEEAIANFGWLGFILGPCLPILVCRVGDSRGGSVGRITTLIVSTWLLIVHIPAFYPILFLWLIAVYFKL